MKHYKLNTGLLKKGDFADFIIAEDLVNFKILSTYINGQLVAEKGISKIETQSPDLINNFNCSKKNSVDFRIKDYTGEVIEAVDGQLITKKSDVSPKKTGEFFESDVEKDILKIVVVNRYHDADPSIAFIKNFGLKRGAIASSVAHDSHNIIAVGADDDSLCEAINLIIEQKGGISIADAAAPSSNQVLRLPVAGLMSDEDGYKVAEKYTQIDAAAKNLGSTLSAPYMTLSFMALLVIPHLKLSDKGLFDGDSFTLISHLKQ